MPRTRTRAQRTASKKASYTVEGYRILQSGVVPVAHQESLAPEHQTLFEHLSCNERGVIIERRVLSREPVSKINDHATGTTLVASAQATSDARLRSTWYLVLLWAWHHGHLDAAETLSRRFGLRRVQRTEVEMVDGKVKGPRNVTVMEFDAKAMLGDDFTQWGTRS